jgi:hypothetical protein
MATHRDGYHSVERRWLSMSAAARRGASRVPNPESAALRRKGHALFVLSRPLPRLGRVSNARDRRPAWRSAVRLCVAVVAVWSAMASLRPATSLAAPSPPFGECPAIGDDTSCGVLIVVNADGTTTSYVNGSQGAVDGADDVLVGILNTSASTVTTVPLTGNGIFALDGDGLCTLSNAPSGCPFGPTSYEGPNTSFSITDENSGTVMFANGLAPGASAYFSLEGAASSVSPPPPGAVLGSLDLNGYCRSLGYSNAVLSNPQHGPQAAYNNWTCVAANGSTTPIDLQKACEATYPERPILAQPTDPDDAYTWRCYQLPQPTVKMPVVPASPALAKTTAVKVANGSVKVSWQRKSQSAPSPITSFVVTATPTGNDRVLAPSSRAVSVSVPASRFSATVGGLLQDCHQVYKVGVTPTMGHTRGATAFWPQSVRPSGVVSRTPPTQVVVLLDGVMESKPGFQMDPYKPTLDGAPSYCPEAWSPTRVFNGSHWSESDFAGAPTGPWSFFDKWNFDDQTSEGSTPRDLRTGEPTHSFMLDALAARGAVILPYSYTGALLEKPHRAHADPRFVYGKYGGCDSTPGCSGSSSLEFDVERLQNEIASIHSVWPSTKIIVVGHSQGGLIAFRWWQKWWLKWGVNFRRASGHTGVYRLFSLDSPINGVCASAVCVGPPGYPSYGLRQTLDPLALTLDERSGNAFRFLGTVGDTVPTPIGNSYGPSGDENLQHQILFDYSHCSDSSGITCPAPAPPDHISNCPITSQSPSWAKQSQHFVVKFCPLDVTYFNTALGLSY